MIVDLKCAEKCSEQKNPQNYLSEKSSKKLGEICPYKFNKVLMMFHQCHSAKKQKRSKDVHYFGYLECRRLVLVVVPVLAN
jgi:hypothetical protein